MVKYLYILPLIFGIIINLIGISKIYSNIKAKKISLIIINGLGFIYSITFLILIINILLENKIININYFHFYLFIIFLIIITFIIEKLEKHFQINIFKKNIIKIIFFIVSYLFLFLFIIHPFNIFIINK